MNKSTKKVLAIIICSLFVVFSLFFFACTAHESVHKCSDQSCPVCSFVHNADQSVKHLGNLSIGLSEIQIPFYLIILVISSGALVVPFTSLIKQKVRLND